MTNTVTRMSVAEAKALLENYAEDLCYPALKSACLKVITDPRMATQFGSAGKHHAYEGGLMIHTAEVTNYAYNMSLLLDDSDEDVVVTAAIFHDYMKVREYELCQRSSPGHLVTDQYGRPATYIGKTDYRNLVRHVAGSHAEFVKVMDWMDTGNGQHNVPEEVILKIEHAILAHHGRYEWGSPVEPQTAEARILHYADMFSVEHGPASKR
jgi:3'-5' exoribonuclease